MHLLIQHQMNGKSGIPKDRYVNTFHVVNGGAFTTTDIDDIFTAIHGMYIHSASSFSVVVDTTGCNMRAYDMADAKPRTPVQQDTAPMPVTGGGAYPNEVSVCLSYQGAVVSGLPAARRRGRIYLGPLASGVGSFGPTAPNNLDVRLDNSMLNRFLVGAQNCRAAIFAAGGGVWSIYSQVNDATVPIETFSMDNAFDTQRRRGVLATSKTTVPAVP